MWRDICRSTYAVRLVDDFISASGKDVGQLQTLDKWVTVEVHKQFLTVKNIRDAIPTSELCSVCLIPIRVEPKSRYLGTHWCRYYCLNLSTRSQHMFRWTGLKVCTDFGRWTGTRNKHLNVSSQPITTFLWELLTWDGINVNYLISKRCDMQERIQGLAGNRNITDQI